MKTTIHRSGLCFAALTALTFTTSCTTSQPVAYQTQTGTYSPQQLTAAPDAWYQVSLDPPVYYPVGMSKDVETDYRHGEWIFAGAGNAMWYVPFEGSTQHSEIELRRQALAMRTGAQKRALARDSVREKVGLALGTTVIGTLTTATVAGSAYVSNGHLVPNPGDTYHSFANDLESSLMNDIAYSIRFREDLYPAEVLADYHRSKAAGDGSASGDSDSSESSLTREANTLLFQHSSEIDGASILDKWNRSTESQAPFGEITYPE